MKVVIIDMTHGGIKIANEFSKLDTYEVFAWDIYHTLKERQKEDLRRNQVELIDEDYLKKNLMAKNEGDNDDLIIIAPVHCKLEFPVDMTHHEAVAFLLKNHIPVPVIEVTGVKGKTSVVHMLKEIFRDLNPLILSSLGVEFVENGESKLLKRDISITPANIILAWELAQEYSIGIFILETSLGGTGLGQVGILTNIAEDYSIAGGTGKASQAKTQIFKDKIVVCDSDSSNQFYTAYKEKTNTFSIGGKGDVRATHMIFGLHETVFQVEVQNLKTVSGEFLHDVFEISTFAPAPHHLENVLSAISASLTMEASLDMIKAGLRRFKGLKGRTSLKKEGDLCIIEEINPGINTTTIRKSAEMLADLPQSAVVFGGKYGITCEEIDEKSASTVLNQLDEDIQLILTDELGESIKKGIKRNYNYIPDYKQVMDYIRQKKFKNILLIYRSNFADKDKR